MNKIISTILIIVTLLSISAFATETTWRHSGFEVAGYDINFTYHNITKITDINGVNFTDFYSNRMANPATADMNMSEYSVLNATNYTTSQGRHLENGGCDTSYCIRYNLTNNSIIEALNGSTGIIDYSGTVPETVINNAINNLPAIGGHIKLSKGTYNITSTIIVKKPSGSGYTGIEFSGEGTSTTIINNTNTSGGHGIQVNDMYFGSFHDFSVRGNNDSGNGIIFNSAISAEQVTFERIDLQYNGMNGFSANTGKPGHGLTLSNIWAEENKMDGIKTLGNFWKIFNVRTVRNAYNGINASDGTETVITMSSSEGNLKRGIVIKNGKVYNNYIGNNAEGDIHITGTSAGVRVYDNYFEATIVGVPVIEVDEAKSYIGTNVFASLSGSAQGIKLDSDHNIVETQIWSYTDNSTSERVDNNNVDNIVYDQHLNKNADTANHNITTGIQGYSNLLLNSDFEFGTLDWSAGNLAILSTETTIVKRGSRSINITGGNAYSDARQSVLNYTDYRGMPVTLSGWFYAPSTNTIANGQRILIDAGTGALYAPAVIPRTDTWTWMQFYFVVPLDATKLEVKLMANYGTASPDRLYVDGLSLNLGTVAMARTQETIPYDLSNRATAPTGYNKGDTYFNTTSNVLNTYDGTQWMASMYNPATADLAMYRYNISNVTNINGVNFTDSLNEPYSYVIYNDASTVYAKNGSTGIVTSGASLNALYSSIQGSNQSYFIKNTGINYDISANIAISNDHQRFISDGATINITVGNIAAFNIYANDITVDGFHIIGYNYTNQSSSEKAFDIYGDVGGLTKNNITIKNNIIENFGMYGIYLIYIDNFLISNNRINNINYGGISGLSVSNGIIESNFVKNVVSSPNAYGIGVTGSNTDNITTNPLSKNVIISNNIIEDIPTWEGLDTHGGNNISFIGNIIKNVKIGISATRLPNASSIGTYAPNNIVISGNIIHTSVFNSSTSNSGIMLIGTDGEKATGSIVGNSIIGFGRSTTEGGIYVENANGVSVSGNTLDHQNYSAIMVRSSFGTTISGNTIKNTHSPDDTNSAIVLSGDSGGYIGGNSFIKTSPLVDTYVMQYAIYNSSGTHNFTIGVNFNDASTYSNMVLNSSFNTNIINANISWDDNNINLQNYIVNDTGLLFHMKFDENSTGTATSTKIYDSSKYSNDGTWNGHTSANWSDGKFGTAGKFDGSDDYILAGNAGLLTNSSYTISFWSYNANFPVYMGSQADNKRLAMSTTATGTYRLILYPNTLVSDLSYNNVDQWIFYVGTYDNSTHTMKIYRNSVMTDSRSDQTSYYDGTGSLYVGSHQPSGDYSNGNVDDVRIYNRALSDSEIETLYLSSPLNDKSSFIQADKFRVVNNTGYESFNVSSIGQINHLIISTTQPATPINGSLFGNTTSKALNWYYDGAWYLPNGTVVT